MTALSWFVAWPAEAVAADYHGALIAAASLERAVDLACELEVGWYNGGEWEAREVEKPGPPTAEGVYYAHGEGG